MKIPKKRKPNVYTKIIFANKKTDDKKSKEAEKREREKKNEPKRQQTFNEFTHKITNHINLCVNKSHIFS